MKNIIKILIASLILLGCVAKASSVVTKEYAPKGQIVERTNDDMLEWAMEMNDERTPAIYVVIISEPEIIIAKPPEK